MDTDEEFNSQEFDFQVSLFALPAITIHWPLAMRSPYLFAGAPDKPVACLGNPNEFTVGLCLKAGEKSKKNRLSRSVPAELAELLRIPGVRYVSLQREPLPEWVEPHVQENSNWRDTASLIEACDLIISVDTAIAHMAGAMGRRVWTILPLNSDWRWFIDRSDSPWYPTMRLFRNRHVTDFRETVEEVGAALLEHASDPSRAREQAVATGVR
jgi:ADP-heptose:LPS heptosyltransferase